MISTRARVSGFRMLGLPLREAPPRVAINNGGGPLAEPYVSIVVQASSVNKK